MNEQRTPNTKQQIAARELLERIRLKCIKDPDCWIWGSASAIDIKEKWVLADSDRAIKWSLQGMLLHARLQPLPFGSADLAYGVLCITASNRIINWNRTPDGQWPM